MSRKVFQRIKLQLHFFYLTENSYGYGLNMVFFRPETIAFFRESSSSLYTRTLNRLATTPQDRSNVLDLQMLNIKRNCRERALHKMVMN